MIKPPPPQTFNFLDFIMIGIILIAGISGFVRGITRGILGLASWGIAFFASWNVAGGIQPYLSNYIHNQELLLASSYGIGFISVLILCSITSSLLSRIIQKSILSGVDRSLGLPFGFAFGYLLLTIFSMFYIFLGADVYPFIKESKLMPFVLSGTNILQTYAESVPWIKDKIHLPSLKERISSFEEKISGKLPDDKKKEIESLAKPQPKAEPSVLRKVYDEKSKQQLDKMFKN